jgi:hypothetical protein
MLRGRRLCLRASPLDDGDDRIALPGLSLGDDPTEPAPVVVDGEKRSACRSAAAHPPWLGHTLDDPPLLGLGQGQAGRAMG